MSVVKLHFLIFLGPVMPGKWVETVSLIAIEHPAFHQGAHAADPNLELH
jgi:hypothetical protein